MFDFNNNLMAKVAINSAWGKSSWATKGVSTSSMRMATIRQVQISGNHLRRKAQSSSGNGLNTSRYQFHWVASKSESNTKAVRPNANRM